MMEVIHREAKLGKQHHLKKTDSSYLWNMEKTKNYKRPKNVGE